MANPTYSTIEGEFRSLVNDTSSVVYTQAEAFSWINQGIGWQHDSLKGRLDQPRPRRPDPNHPYWRQFWATDPIALVVDQVEYALPAAETKRFDIFHSLLDATTLKPLSPYDPIDELTLSRGSVLGVGRDNGFFAFVPPLSIRVLVSPGSFGVPKEVRNLTLRYFRAIYLKASPAGGDSIDIRLDFQRAPTLFAAYRAMQSRGRAAPALLEEAASMIGSIPQ